MTSLRETASRAPKACCACVVLLAVGAGFLANGIHYATDNSSDAHRATLVTEYNAAVQSWSDLGGGRERFLSLGPTWNASVCYTIEEEGTHCIHRDLITVIQGDVLKDADPDELLHYTPLRYGFNGDPGITRDDWSVLSGNWTLSSPSGTILTLPVALTEETIWGSISWKVCAYQRHGAYLGGKCHVYRRLAEACLRVVRREIQGWGWPEGDTTNWGCEATAWNPWTRDIIGVDRYGPPPRVDLSELKIGLRSWEDPFLVAQKLTGGTLNFGVTKGQRKSNATMFIIAGAISMVSSVALLVCWIRGCGYFSDEFEEERAPSIRIDALSPGLGAYSTFQAQPPSTPTTTVVEGEGVESGQRGQKWRWLRMPKRPRRLPPNDDTSPALLPESSSGDEASGEAPPRMGLLEKKRGRKSTEMDLVGPPGY